MDGTFRVGITRDCLKPSGALTFDPAALVLLKNAPGVAYEIMPEYAPEITQAQAARYDAIVVLAPRTSANTLAGDDRRLRIVARVGVGYDNVDTEACTRAGVMVTITPDGVRRPVATVVLTFILALAHKLFIKDRLARTGRWDERTEHMGVGLTGKTVGTIGFGNIGQEIFRLIRPLEMAHIGYDPIPDRDAADAVGLRLVDFDTVFREADFVTINCPLSAVTRGLVGARELALMKPTSYLINTARGPIVDEAALYRALAERRIAGAAIDVFEQEPTPPDNPILKLDNVITTPHSLCWTDECFRRMAEDAFRSVLAVAAGRRPDAVVNRAVLAHPNWRALAGT